MPFVNLKTRLKSFAGKVPPKRRRGAIIVLAAIMMIVMMGLLALSIDTGYMYTMQTQLDRAVDSAALAGAGSLVDGVSVANDKVVEYLVRNPVGQPNSIIAEDQISQLKTQFLADHPNDYEVTVGQWNAQTGQLEQAFQLPSAIAVTMKYSNLPLFFGRALGKNSFSVQAQAIAMYQPRDIMVVLDFSGSMNDDSELKSINKFGYTVIMNGLQQIHQELGSPIYGDMLFEPQYITVNGVTPSVGGQAQIAVEYRYKSAQVTASETLNSITLKLSNGNTQTFSGLSGTTKVVAGTGSNAGKAIYRVWVNAGTNAADDGSGRGETFDFSSNTITATIKTALGLDSVPYPYPSGSWNDYVYYIKTSWYNYNAGFYYKFGYANLINYWLERRPTSYQTPDLWKVSAYPVTAVKDAVDVFMDYITTVDTDDRLGLVVYDSSVGEAELETGLTTNLLLIADLARQRQAGHYHRMTNIGAGMEVARQELQANGRMGAFKMIVLMTDGQANWHNGQHDTTGARNHVIAEANAAADLNYPIVAISLGAGADLSLMQQVADITKSRHFNIPGGQAVAAYRDDLFLVFREIADSRPLKLVH